MRISDFTLRNLRTFCAVAEHGGFLGAQAVLGMSQPAISAHIKDLEVALGFPLCRRGRAGFALTEKGEAVYARAKEMLAGVEDCEARLGELRRALTGRLRIGLVDSEATNPELPVADAIRRFFARDKTSSSPSTSAPRTGWRRRCSTATSSSASARSRPGRRTSTTAGLGGGPCPLLRPPPPALRRATGAITRPSSPATR